MNKHDCRVGPCPVCEGRTPHEVVAILHSTAYDPKIVRKYRAVWCRLVCCVCGYPVVVNGRLVS